MSEIRICCLHSLKGGATDVTPAEGRVNFNVLWIAVGAVALAVLFAVFGTMCACGVLCSKRRRKYVFDTGMTWEGRSGEGETTWE